MLRKGQVLCLGSICEERLVLQKEHQIVHIRRVAYMLGSA